MRWVFRWGFLVFGFGLLAAGSSHAQSPPGKQTGFEGFVLPGLEAEFANPFAPLTEEQERALSRIEITPKAEAALGEEAVAAYVTALKAKSIGVLKRGKDVEYLQQLVDELRPQLQQAPRYSKLRIRVLKTQELEARAFPGGTLFFSQGFLTFCQNEAALVGMLGHELSHLDRGHLLVPLKRMQLLREQQPGSSAQLFESGTLFMRLMKPFRPEHEAEADRDGTDWMLRAGYDPRELAALFERLAERERERPEFVPQFLRSHPATEDRRKAVLEQVQAAIAADAGQSLYVGTQNLKLRIPRSEKSFAE